MAVTLVLCCFYIFFLATSVLSPIYNLSPHSFQYYALTFVTFRQYIGDIMTPFGGPLTENTRWNWWLQIWGAGKEAPHSEGSGLGSLPRKVHKPHLFGTCQYSSA